MEQTVFYISEQWQAPPNVVGPRVTYHPTLPSRWACYHIMKISYFQQVSQKVTHPKLNDKAYALQLRWSTFSLSMHNINYGMHYRKMQSSKSINNYLNGNSNKVYTKIPSTAVTIKHQLILEMFKCIRYYLHFVILLDF